MAILIVPSAEFPTIQSAVAVAMPGDIVEILQGTYNENIEVQNKNDIIIRGKKTESIGLLAMDQSSIGINIRHDSSKITVQNMNIFNFSAGILISGDKCKLIDLGINNSIFNGIEVRGNKNSIINNRLIQNLVGVGFDGDSNIITNNVFLGNTAAGISNTETPTHENIIKTNSIGQSQVGILLNAKGSSNNKFLNNIIAINASGFIVKNQCNRISSNIIRNNQQDGLNILSNNNVVTKNVINVNQNGVVVVGNKNRITNNVIKNNEFEDIINTGKGNDIRDNE
ncbi:right-handed parallel beta-helix repeat-containing protein [Vallitalea okinawensis]|uniref:right-handed parallel beta-helix repeat-containing protein n=1 Tax=Vallitalea okinawensis TaxID=2078660 RepID=UPI000CFD6476|nr:NosD domain-containing protein [Vallitalea okinawensis]